MKTPRHTVATALAKRSLQATSPTALRHLGREIAAYLLAEHRTGELDAIIRDILQYRADQGIVEVIAVTAFPFSSNVQADITAEVREQYPSAKQIIVSQRHDQTVVGGVRLEFANQQLDLSIRSKLNRLKQITQAGKER
jgi:F0F1-type ATP synthase delta subunit